jgi:GDP-4-dehydro-6-deoxy-D-mannose reductase
VKAFITGATGFVGPVLGAHCREEGDEVVNAGDAGNGFDVTDRVVVHDALVRHRPDVVYHLAAQSHVGDSWQDPTRCLRVNIEGTAHVLDGARAAGVERVLVVGSAEEYGRVDDTRRPIGEDTPLRPLTPYGASKVGSDFLALQAWLGHGLETIRVRSFSHTGRGQSERFVVPALAGRIARALRDERDYIPVGSLEPVRDIGDVRDVVRAYRLLVLHGLPGEVYNVATSAGHSIRDVALELLALAPRTLRLELDPELVRPVDVPWLIGDNTKLRAVTGWEPRCSLKSTLVEVLAGARERAGQGS